jgi:Protein kinase domain/PEGA domain/SLBB domain/zinc-ribbon domain
MMRCSKCQHENPASALFCLKCGAELPASEAGSVGNAPTLGPAGEIPSIGDLPTLRTRQFRAGEKLMERYRILGELGRGGMGVVYKCLDEVGGIEVALKALPPELSHNSGEMEEVRENFQLVTRLTHPNIAAVKNLERDPRNGDYYLILELAEGVDLRRWRKQRGGKVPLEEALPALKQIALALDYAHSRKIVHRDIKPGNIMVSSDGTVKVLDFGLAAQIQSSLSRVSQMHFSTSGTGPYMAPEQWRGKKQDGAADQYALAVSIYEIICGHPPFEAPDQVALRESVLRETPDRPVEISEAQWKVLERALAKEPGQRFANCTGMVEALAGNLEFINAVAKTAATAPRPESRKPSLQTVAAGMAVGLVVISVLAGGWYWKMYLPEQEKIQAAEAAAKQAAQDKANAEAVATRLAEERHKAAVLAAQKAAEEKAKAETEAARQAEEKRKANELAVKQAQEEKARLAAAEQKRQRDEAARQEAEHLANARGGLTADTIPKGAIIGLSGEDFQTSPVNFKDIHVGKKELTITKDGYEPVRQDVEIKENQVLGLGTIKLVRQTGSVRITSNPEGATVTQNGKELGATPLELNSVPTGFLNFNLKLSGFQDTQVMGLVENKQQLLLTASLSNQLDVLSSQTTQSKFQITGEVAHPGTFLIDAPITLSEAVQMAGYFTDFADTTRLIITHTAAENPTVSQNQSIAGGLLGVAMAKATIQQAQEHRVNFKKQSDLKILPGDTIVVRRKMF